VDFFKKYLLSRHRIIWFCFLADKLVKSMSCFEKETSAMPRTVDYLSKEKIFLSEKYFAKV